MGKSFYKSIVLAMGLLFCATSLFAQVTQGIRVAFGGASGTAKYSDDSSFDHNLSGTAFGLNYIRILENNVLFGGGFQTMETSGSKTVLLDSIKITYQDNFLYGVVGYKLAINEQFSFQPNLKLGFKSLKITGKYKKLLKETSSSSTGSAMGIDIVLPVIYKFNETIGAGANLCLCGSAAQSSSAGVFGKETYTSLNVLNLSLDIYF